MDTNHRIRNVVAGETIDIKSLLSSDQQDYLVSTRNPRKRFAISNLNSEYVIVCFLKLPLDEGDGQGPTCQDIIALHDALSPSSQCISRSVIFVIVAMIKPDSNLSAKYFHRFISTFPSGFLAIPWCGSESRYKLCNSYYQHILAVNRLGNVLPFDDDILSQFGGHSFPFTSEHFDSLRQLDANIKSSICSCVSPFLVKQLLESDYLPQLSNPETSIATPELNNKPVALYLCTNGGRLHVLNDIHQSCLEKGLDFEVVFVPMPFWQPDDPTSFQELMVQRALCYRSSICWWLFPFQEKVCRTLWRLVDCDPADRLVILPHSGWAGDLEGLFIGCHYGINAYPFTKDAMIERTLNDLRSRTLQDLLGVENTRLWNLENRNVLLYFDYPTYVDAELAELLKPGVCKTERQFVDFEVVFVPLKRVSEFKDNWLSKMKWPILPTEKRSSVTKHVFSDTDSADAALVAFGKDGKLLSRLAHERLCESKSYGCLFEDTLRSELRYSLEQEMFYSD